MYSKDIFEFTINNDKKSYSVACRVTVSPISIDEIPSAYLGKPVTSIRLGWFANRKSLTSIVIPDSITMIGPYAFRECTSLTSIVIPNGVSQISSDAFKGCKSLTSLNIPNTVTSIGEGAFYSCESLTSIVIPNSVTSIGLGAFAICKSLTIYAEASSKPFGWSNFWNSSNRPVVWGYFG